MTRSLLLLAAALVIAAGCQMAPRSIQVLLEPDGTVKVNGQTATDSLDLCEVLKKTHQQQQDAVKNVAAPKTGTSIPPCKVTIEVSRPEKNTYEQFCLILLACGSAEIERVEIAGVPSRLPRAGHVNTRNIPKPAELSFLPMEFRKAADAEALKAHSAELKGLFVLIHADMETPLDLVLIVLKVVHQAGAKFGFAIPYDGDEEGPPKVTIRDAYPIPLGAREDYMPLILERKPTTSGKPASPPSGIAHIFTDNPFPDVASSNLTPLEMIGVGNNSAEDKDAGKDDGKKDNDLGKGRSFFGIPVGDAHKIVFVLDRSGSMTDSIDYVKYVTKRCISQLTEKDLLDVLFMSSGPPVEMPPKKLVPATDKNKELAFEFIDGVIAQGETTPEGALERAFELKPEVIFLLTDGEFDRAVVDLVKKLNAEKKVKVNTICFLYETGGALLKEIAAQNGGTYKFVSEKDLTALSSPETRP